MKKKVWSWIGLAFLALMLTAVESAEARPKYRAIWAKKYRQANPEMDKVLLEAEKSLKTANCNVCHAGAKRKNRNAYGTAMSKVVPKNVLLDDKILEALEDIEGQKSDPNDEGSPIWGDLIKAGKLPITTDEPAAP